MPELPELHAILNSSSLAYGQYGKEFEKSLNAFLGTQQLLTTNTFNMSILVALSTLNISAGDEVIASPMSCLASTQPLLSQGLRVNWADVDPETGTLDPDSVRNKISPKTKLIIHNHYCGLIGYIDAINAIGKEYEIPVIDDGIEAFGGEYKGKKIGNCGTDVTIFSFGAVRIPNTIDGGAVIFKDKTLFEKGLLIRDCGIDRTRFRDEIGEINPACDITLIGHSATMSDVNSYLGIQQMKKMHKILSMQRRNALLFDTELNHCSDKLRPVKRAECKQNYWVYTLLAHNRDHLLDRLKRSGVAASKVHLRNDLYSAFGSGPANLPGVAKFSAHCLSIPCGWWVSDKDCTHILNHCCPKVEF